MFSMDFVIESTIPLIEALSLMDKRNKKLLIICDDGIFKGVVSIGDVQRAIIGKMDISLPVVRFVRPDITVAHVGDDIARIKNKMRRDRIEAMPVIDANYRLVDIIEWDDLFEEDEENSRDIITYPVVVMAGGMGTRLLPLTNIIPKPLIPISDKTIIEEILTLFSKVGCKKFYISVNYKKESIIDYLEKKDLWNIEYLDEEKPLGTAGSLFLLKNRINEPFFVINCDTLLDIKLSDLVEYHKVNQNLITVVSIIKKLSIPYGTIETKKNGIICDIKEKPEYVYQINSGMYILEPEALDYI